jgi:formate-dependent nitrite reductase cytochrome c552 subunit
MDDRRTNYFPWVGVLGLKARYEEVGFKDFRHATTGALLTKIQHPETESYWGSRHEAKGVECKHCHMPREVGEDGKEYTYHGAMAARSMPKIACRNCHSMWSREDAEYRIEAIQNYTRGKITKAEFWLGELIDAYARAKEAGVPEETLAKARDAHDTAHILWEWWTAENSDGFHNPQLARDSLTRSITVSQDAVALLTAAVDEQRKDRGAK